MPLAQAQGLPVGVSLIAGRGNDERLLALARSWERSREDRVSLGRQAAARGGRGNARRDPARTRTKLLKAAIAEFSEQGFHGARTDRIAKRAGTNIRMLYHYFGSKDDLYVAVLEVVLADLRHDELRIDRKPATRWKHCCTCSTMSTRTSAKHPELRKLLAFENLNEARHLARSQSIFATSSPVIALLRRLLQRGASAGSVRAGVDALHLYVAMVSLAYYGRAHAFTLSQIFGARPAPAGLAGLAPEADPHHGRQLPGAGLTRVSAGAGRASPAFARDGVQRASGSTATGTSTACSKGRSLMESLYAGAGVIRQGKATLRQEGVQPDDLAFAHVQRAVVRPVKIAHAAPARSPAGARCRSARRQLGDEAVGRGGHHDQVPRRRCSRTSAIASRGMRGTIHSARKRWRSGSHCAGLRPASVLT
jgi:AcrR family transcriptional regulator